MGVQDFHMARIRGGFLQDISDEMVIARTGRSWAAWDAILAAWDLRECGFEASARRLRNEYEISTWWSNTITARHFWLRGLAD